MPISAIRLNTPPPTITGAGSLDAGDSAISGIGSLRFIASGDLQAGAASVTGTDAIFVASGNLSSGASSVAGVGQLILRLVSAKEALSEAAKKYPFYVQAKANEVVIGVKEVSSENQRIVESYAEAISFASNFIAVSSYVEALSILQLSANVKAISESYGQVIDFSNVASLALSSIVDFKEISAPILDYDTFTVFKKAMSVISNSSALLENHQAYLILPDGSHEEFLGTVSCDEGSAYWQANITVGFRAFNLLKVDDAIVVVINGFEYYLIVDSKNRRVGSVYTEVTYAIVALSPIVKKQKPRNRGLTVTYDTSIDARTTVEDLLLGFDVEWNILDWLIPANRLSVENADILETAQQIAAAPGGLIESKPDGSLVVRYIYPVSPTAYSSSPIDAVSTTDLDIFEYSEEDKLGEYFNRIRISDVPPDDFNDYIEYVEDLSVLRAFTFPFDGNAWLTHTSSGISLSRVGVTYEVKGDSEDEREVVEIIQGKGSTKYPIFSIDSFTYLFDNLGGLSFDQDSTTVYTANQEGYSLVEIVYTTRYIEYRVAGNGVREAQFLLNRSVY